MANPLVHSVLSKLAAYIEAESNLGLDLYAVDSSTSRIIRRGSLNLANSHVLQFTCTAYSPLLKAFADVSISVDLSGSGVQFAGRKPIRVSIKYELDLNNYALVAQYYQELSKAYFRDDLKKPTVEANGKSKVVFSFMEKKISLFKDLKLTKQEAERANVALAFVLASQTSDLPFKTRNHENKDPDKSGIDKILGQVVEQLKQTDETEVLGWHKWSKPEGVRGDYERARLFTSYFYRGNSSELQNAACPARGALYLSLYNFGASLSLLPTESYTRISKQGIQLENEEICSSCSNQLSCLSSNYQDIPYTMELVLPLA